MSAYLCRTWLVAIAWLVTCAWSSAQGLSVSFDNDEGCFTISDAECGEVLKGGIRVRPIDPPWQYGLDSARRSQERRTTDEGEELLLTGSDGIWARFTILNGKRTVEIRAGDKTGRGTVRADHLFPQMGDEPIVGLLKDQASRDRHVLTTTLGPATFANARAIYDRERDLAFTIEAEGDAAWFVHEGQTDVAPYRIECEVPCGGLLLRLTLRPHYYRDELGIRYFAPIQKRSFWKTAPSVAMTWYGTHVQTKENLFPLIDWVAENLLPYAGQQVFQLDDNYAIHDDVGMREIASYIRQKGLIPGIWVTPFTVIPPGDLAAHPDWFLRSPNGDTLKGFGGISYGALGGGQNYMLDVRNADARAQYEVWWRKLSETWGFDFFKIDGQPWVADVYRQAAGAPGVEAYREALADARRIIGPDRFINGCWGIPLEAIGRINGSRTGGDTGNQAHAIDVILRWEFLNNVCWWCDSDAAANLATAPIERVRLNAQARALTGQQFLTDDIWTKVPEEVAHVWQRALPTADIRPANLYPIENWSDYTVFDLKIDPSDDPRDVVGLFNCTPEPKSVELDLGALGLESRTYHVRSYHVYDFWGDRYLGLKPSDAKLTFWLKPYEGKLLGICRPGLGGLPCVIAATRHVTQGGLDVRDEWSGIHEEGPGLAGRSELLVAGEPCTLLIAAGNMRIEAATTDNGKATWTSRPGINRLTIAPERSGEAQWSVDLVQPEGPRLEAEAWVELQGERIGVLRLANPGTEAVSCHFESTVQWLRFQRPGGILKPGEQVEVDLLPAGGALPWDRDLRDEIVITTEPKAPGTPLRLPVELRTGLPPNLALQATASASSVWPGYEAALANDGSALTRWNSREGEKDGTWLALTWSEPVRFDRVVVDETREWGPRVQEWVLEAREGDEWRPLANGTTLGPVHRIDLPLTTARELRLRMPHATSTPTMNEMDVYRFEPEAK
jgi:hypothetical protein